MKDILKELPFLVAVLMLAFSLPQGLKNAVKAEHEKIYQKVEKKSIDFLEKTDRIPLP